MKILITGGNGFIASNLKEQLSEEHQIIACNRLELDLLDTAKVYNYIKRGHFNVVIHTATYDPAPKYSTKDPVKVLGNNLRMFFNIARAKDYFGKMIYFGSGAEFSREHWRPKMKESYFDQHVPIDQYGLSKYVMAKQAEQSDNIFNLRVFSVFGKYEDWRYRFISRACCCAIMNRPVIIKQNVRYDFMSIDDLARIVDWFINNKPRERIYNVCSGLAASFVDLAKIVAKVSGKKLAIKIKAPGLGVEYSGDNSRLLNEMGRFKFTQLEESIKSLYAWYSANKRIIKKEELA